MADVRSLLRNERASRRITHPHASYSTTGKLICLPCQLQLKSESLWNGHLRSSQHLAHLQKYEEEQALQSAAQEPEPSNGASNGNTPELLENGDAMPSKKRKMSPTIDEQEGPNKRSRNGSTEALQLKDQQEPVTPVMLSPLSAELPSRPSSTVPPETDTAAVDEDEWAAFEKDIEAASQPIPAEATISAPAISAADLANKTNQTAEETYNERKARLEAEQEEDKEDAARKLEDEFEEMKGFEERVRKLKEKREQLRAAVVSKPIAEAVQYGNGMDTDLNGVHSHDEEEEESSEDEDDWHGFRLKV